MENREAEATVERSAHHCASSASSPQFSVLDDWPARAAWFALINALNDLADRGRTTPCQVDPAPFHADIRADRAEAAAACRACPVLRACAAFALANDEPLGVWGSVDLTPHTGPGGSAQTRRAKLEDAAAGVLVPDLVTPAKGPAAAPERGPRPCDECGAPFVPKTPHARFCRGACRTRANRRSHRAQSPGGGSRTGAPRGQKTAAVRPPTPDRDVVTVTAPSQSQPIPRQETSRCLPAR